MSPTIKVKCIHTGETSQYPYPDTEKGREDCADMIEALDKLKEKNCFTVEKID